MPSEPLGIKNNNYLNVKNDLNDPWMDATGKPSKSDSQGHAVFTDPASGVRAGILLLRTYFRTHQLKTPLEIISRWAPADDLDSNGQPKNEPTAYAVFVAEKIGVGINQKLELFNTDGTIDNAGQLKDLFYAMAAMEVGGGFKVPDKVFKEGLELVEPGINKAGTGPALAHAAAPSPQEVKLTKAWKIGGSVGRPSKATNDVEDVKTVQELLRSAAMILQNPSLDPGGLDGIIPSNAPSHPTVKAIIAFQRRFLTNPDGVIEVDGRTWRELPLVVSGAAEPKPETSGQEFFPFASLPSENWTSSPRKFAANRGANRAHAGCDLYFPAGTIIHAIADGTVTQGPYDFYMETFALEVDHGTFLARYGEIQKNAFDREGDRVTAGQPIARVGHLVGITVPSDMLHLELYDKTAHGPLSVGAANSAIAANGRPFLRRKDLIDPTPFLNKWKDNLLSQPSPALSAPASALLSAKGTKLSSSPRSKPKKHSLESSTFALSSSSAAPAIPSKGFCIWLNRLREETRSGLKPRTVGDYICYWNGEPIHDLDGQMVERFGPGNNTSSGVDKTRVKAGTYRLRVHDGPRYKTYRYDKDGGFPLPGLLLDGQDTKVRTDILIHPCHDEENGYLSSIGCLNPAFGLKDAASKINLKDSRARVIAIIEAMKSKMGSDFPKTTALIPNAVIIITGEPS